MYGYNFYGCSPFAGMIVWMWEIVDEVVTAWTKVSKTVTGWTEEWKPEWL